MGDSALSADDKPFAATPSRRRRAQREGNVARSAELSSVAAFGCALLAACERYADKDDRVKIVRYEDLVYPGLTVHAFYVKYLLPIYFDVQSIEHAASGD